MPLPSYEIRQLYNWKQHTPKDQLVAIKQSVWGSLDNLQDFVGYDTAYKYANTVAGQLEYYAEQLEAIAPYLKNNRW